MKITDGDGRLFELAARGEGTLLDALRSAGLAPDAPCGGHGKCGKCGVTVSGLCRRADGTEAVLDGEFISACRIRPAGALSVTLPRSSGARVLTGGADIAGGGSGLALAVDIGTTTLAVYLYDRASGKCLASAGEYNRQGAYGGDVIRRIQYAASPGGLETLSGAVRSQITDMARALCGGDIGGIEYIAIAGNTVMEHLFAGISPESIGVAPYEPQSRFGGECAAGRFFDRFFDGCRVYICPAIAGFVGGDVTAGLLSSGAYKSERPVLFIDVGTNGEIALGGKDGFFCCSAAAGPAFEGGEIECGSPARTGAICAVDGGLHISVIGGGAPQSICGSGLIDAAAALLGCGELDETGRLARGRYDFGSGVYISGRDIRQLQLAKAAVRAGIDTVAQLGGYAYRDIGRVLLAGGFGAAMDVRSACSIGLLPAELAGRTQYVGNASGLGAAMALNEKNRHALRDIQSKCRYEELTVSPLFSEKYIASMLFGEPDKD